MKHKFDNDEKSLILKYWLSMPEDLVSKFQNKRLSYIHVTMDHMRDIVEALSNGLIVCSEHSSATVIVNLCERLETLIAISEVMAFCRTYNIDLTPNFELLQKEQE